MSFVKRIIDFCFKHRGACTGVLVMVLLFIWYGKCLDQKLFRDPVSTVLYDANGKLLGARIASDGQWRFPEHGVVPEKFAHCITAFEDKRFYRHPGVDAMALMRALWLNLKRGQVVSGGSTLTMQVIRMSRKGKPRTVWEKLKEIILATRLELRTDKRDILSLYTAHAPFGGNVVGLEAASWRYYDKAPDKLSWGEAATLAVLPNAPALIYPGNNTDALRKKRDRLLSRMAARGIISKSDAALAQDEPLPAKPYPLPALAKPLLDRMSVDNPGGAILHSTIRKNMQQKVTDILAMHHKSLLGNRIHNGAVIVIDVRSAQVLSYVANTERLPGEDPEEGFDVDLITAPRSTGSVMKPFLYAMMQQEGVILPNTLIPDIPTRIDGYNPKNYNKDYDGAVPAARALARSLNVPAVYMLRRYGVPKLLMGLRKCGLKTLPFDADHYGLSLILGGAESTLWDLSHAYLSMARSLRHFRANNGLYSSLDFTEPKLFIEDEQQDDDTLLDDPPITAAASWLTFNALLAVNRPDEESNWTLFSSSRKVAWKTGTSFGGRDAWAIGVTPDYVVGVWAGNADGEGRPGLSGLVTAAPILFDVFSSLPGRHDWFEPPYDELVKIPVCHQSGQRTGIHCPDVDSIRVCKNGLRTQSCAYHHLIHLDAKGQYRVSSSCYPVSEMITRPWFVLPPLQEWYYRQRHPEYRIMPYYLPGCYNENDKTIALIYPLPGSEVSLPKYMDGTTGQVVFEAAGRNGMATLFWHLDNEYLGKTHGIHKISAAPDEGEHRLTIVDTDGHEISISFTVVAQNE